MVIFFRASAHYNPPTPYTPKKKRRWSSTVGRYFWQDNKDRRTNFSLDEKEKFFTVYSSWLDYCYSYGWCGLVDKGTVDNEENYVLITPEDQMLVVFILSFVSRRRVDETTAFIFESVYSTLCVSEIFSFSSHSKIDWLLFDSPHFHYDDKSNDNGPHCYYYTVSLINFFWWVFG